ncbi:hypothetical protein MIN45_P0205 [Methylomarinovum tepidoasis]|uniref:Diguanylate cyclase n=1 Tax=Methylomarinovum tepidoasis TaxID=2840183 RepID=A0AAU9BWP7_9GAMM|nr:hypothetical protein MIN45_P0205 [Methylomarinovum sp. IN45]
MPKRSDRRSLSDFLFETRAEEWQALGFYARFEQVVAVTVTVIISVVIVFALLALVREVVAGLVFGGLEPLNQEALKRLFGMIMTVLIAMEFKHSIIKVAGRRESIIRVRTVVLIALMALARKFIILDAEKMSAATLAALSLALLALSVAYWLIREQDLRLAQRSSGKSRGRTRSRNRPFPGPRSAHPPETASRSKAAVGSSFFPGNASGPHKASASSSRPGLWPTTNTLRAVSRQDRSTASKSDTEAS